MRALFTSAPSLRRRPQVPGNGSASPGQCSRRNPVFRQVLERSIGVDEDAQVSDERTVQLSTLVGYLSALAVLAVAVFALHFLRSPARVSNAAASSTVPGEPSRVEGRIEQVNDRLDRLSGRLDQLSARLDSGATPMLPYASAAAIASEITRQVPREAPPVIRPTFSFEIKASSIADGQLQFAVFVLTRRGVPASDFVLKTPEGISGWMDSISTSPEADRYQISFQPQSGFLTAGWAFSISYLSNNSKRELRVFQAVFDPNDQTPARLRIVEKVD